MNPGIVCGGLEIVFLFQVCYNNNTYLLWIQPKFWHSIVLDVAVGLAM